MKKLILLILFASIFVFAYSQDTILLKNGTKVEAKVIEINSTSIKYLKFEQQDGPIRILEKHEVSEIVYEDGTTEKFNVNGPSKPGTVTVRPVKVEKPIKDPFFGRGFFLDVFVGATEYSRHYTYYYSFDPYYAVTNTKRANLVTLGIRVGNKWYFGKNERWRPGVQATWLRLGFHLGENMPEDIITGPKTFSFANVGMANIFKFNEKLGLELNGLIGPTVAVDLNDGIFSIGMSYSFEAKIRIKRLALGIDYQYSELNQSGVTYTSDIRTNLNSLALTAGLKF